MMQPGMKGYGSSGRGAPTVTDLNSALQAAQKLLGDLENPRSMPPPAATMSPADYKNSLAAAAKAVSEAVGKLLGEAAKVSPDKGILNGAASNLMNKIPMGKLSPKKKNKMKDRTYEDSGDSSDEE